MSSDQLYWPLAEREVRLLKLFPGEPSDAIYIELFHESLASCPPVSYEAVSYTWGNPEPTQVVLANGHELDLTINAYNLLNRLRRRDESRILWMDCLCIDQGNSEERAEQVKIMHLVYSQARTVIVWLGLEAEDSTIAMEHILQLKPEPYLEEIQRFRNNRNSLERTYLFDSLQSSEENRRLVASFAALFHREWLGRIWVRQEAMMCADTRMLCGNCEVSWDCFVSLAWLMLPRGYVEWPAWTKQVYFEDTDAGIETTLAIHYYRLWRLKIPDIWALDSLACPRYPVFQISHLEQVVLESSVRDGPGGSASSDLAKVIMECSPARATDPRDKIYALYNVASFPTRQDLRDRPPIDYVSPWQKVFIKTAKCLYANTRLLNSARMTLDMAGRSLQDKSELPSWVPDWRQNVYHNPFNVHREWSAGGTAYLPHLRFLNLLRTEPEFESMPKYLFVDKRGRSKRIPNEGLERTAQLLDRVIYMNPVIESGYKRVCEIIDQLIDKVSSDLKYITTHVPKYFTGESVEDAYAATIIASTAHDGTLATRDYEKEGFARWQSWLENKTRDAEPAYQDAVLDAVAFTSKAYCVTAHGIMGLVPDIAREGDYMGILSGLQWPVVLRKVGSPGSQYFELLGACYMHRMMRGRAWGLIEEFKGKYKSGSEDEVCIPPTPSLESLDVSENEALCGSFPFNPKSDYASLLRVLGMRRIVLV